MMSPKLVKLAWSGIPRDKKINDKNSVLSCGRIRALNWFSKVYKNILKKNLWKKTNNLFSLFICAYRGNLTILSMYSSDLLKNGEQN